MVYNQYTKDTLVIKEGNISTAFYFVLSGQLEIFKTKYDEKVRLIVCNMGDCFGDRSMNLINDKRTASATCLVDSELLSIDKSMELCNYSELQGYCDKGK